MHFVLCSVGMCLIVLFYKSADVCYRKPVPGNYAAVLLYLNSNEAWFWCHYLCSSEIILYMLSCFYCVFCRVPAAPSYLSQPKAYHGSKNMSVAASTISSAISSQSRYICKALFFYFVFILYYSLWFKGFTFSRDWLGRDHWKAWCV